MISKFSQLVKTFLVSLLVQFYAKGSCKIRQMFDSIYSLSLHIKILKFKHFLLSWSAEGIPDK